MKKLKKYFPIIILFVSIIGFIGIHFIAPYGITQPPRINTSLLPQDLGLNSERLHVKTEEGFALDGHWIKGDLDTTKGLIVFVHGIGGCKEHFLPLTKELASKGIESIIFDGRAHGKSEGDFCTYGFYEKRDIVRIVDKVKSQHPNIKIGIWGNSMGGAIAIQSLAIEPRLDFGIIESTFTELNVIVHDYKKRILKGFGIKFLSNYALRRAGKIANFNPDKVKPIQSVKHIEQPILLAHGDADRNIHVEYGKQLFNNIKSTDKELVIIIDGGHLDLFAKGGAEYKMKLDRFIMKNLK